SFRWNRLGAQPGQRGLRSDLAITQGTQHFQNLAPGRERPAVVALVLIHRLHEGDLLVGVVAFTGGGVDLPAPLAGATLLRAVGLAAFDRHRNVALATVLPAQLALAITLTHDRQPRHYCSWSYHPANGAVGR